MHERENALKEWLSYEIKLKDFSVTPLTGDASFRRYFRLHYNGLTQIVMDAPPGKEDLEPFIHIATILNEAGIFVPQIIAADKKQGFLLLSDFGDQLLLNKLNEQTADQYYLDALKTLLQIQKCSINNPQLTFFDKKFMMQEMNLCPEWFFKAYLSLELSDNEIQLIHTTMKWITDQIANQPVTFIHRDYHSRNLMLIDETLGVIDFQDAMRGPLTYDVVSLLKDCYICWPKEKILKWLSFFHQQSEFTKNYSFPEFVRAFDLCGMQRHLKVLGIFCRLYLRDNKPGYLENLPLTLKYVLECSETYEELLPFFNFLQKRVILP